MLGTAFPASRLLLVEQSGPWGRAGLAQSRFDRTTAHRLIARLDPQHVRVVAIRRPGRSSPPDRRRWAAVDCRPGRERLVWGRFRSDRELLELDIDHFKRINDTHGHLVGDLVIRHIADLCNKGVRGIDEVARIGGEEFAILLIGTALERAVEVAERIRMLVESSTVPGPNNLSVTFTVSIGATQMRADDMSDLDLFSRVDAALYAAKAGGRNRVMSSE